MEKKIESRFFFLFIVVMKTSVSLMYLKYTLPEFKNYRRLSFLTENREQSKETRTPKGALK